MTRFSPIAVVGQGCVLPGAASPASLWENVLAGVDGVTAVPEGRFGVSPASVAGTEAASVDATYSTAGGYVRDFEESFDAGGFDLPASALEGLDPLFHWVLHASRAALLDAGLGAPYGGAGRAGLILGNLSFPSDALARFGASVLLAEHAPAALHDGAAKLLGLERPDARNRFMSGLPAHLGARALGLDAGGFCLDAACASSLYAIRLAADWLHEGRADVMLAGAVNRADSLFLHVGFCALKAMSPSGRSRPFHREADGLVPAEGAGVVALMRLEDALAQRRRVLGVIRGVGLSNDGRGKNLLAPSSQGQVAAMRAAYAQADLSPASVSLVECHATGTATGDATELASMLEVFGGAPEQVRIGSLKSNFGHLITAAGVAGLQKVLGALAYKRVPPSLHGDDPLEALDAGSPLRLVREAEDWSHDESEPRRAAVSAFGFGGNNAHLLVEEWREGATAVPAVRATTAREPLAIVGIGARVGGARGKDALARLALGEQAPAPLHELQLDAKGVRFPPKDLGRALPQQLLAFEAARDALADATTRPDGQRTGVLIGMGVDVDVTTPGVRWRAGEWARRWSELASLGLDEQELAAWAADLREQVCPPVTAQDVLGQMPNIPANRINVQLDLRGPGFTVSAEELSGLAALSVAASWLRDGELDAVLVGAVDVCGDVRHRRAVEALTAAAPRPLDAAVVLVVKRLSDAERDGDDIYASIEADGGGAAPPLSPGAALFGAAALDDESPSPGIDLTKQLGHAHAASGLLHVAAAAACLARRALRGSEAARVDAGGLGGARAWVDLKAGPVPVGERPTAEVAPAIPVRRRTHRELRRLPSPPGRAAQLMEAAPSLPPVTSLAPTNAPSIAQPRAPSPPVPNELWQALIDQGQDMSAAHQAFLEAQGQAHTAFLEHRAAQTRRFGALLHAAPEQAPPAHAPAERAPLEHPTLDSPTLEPPALEGPAPERPSARPLLDRGDLVRLASGRISEVLGPLFARQDGFPRQVRMPEPPLLLCDRVLDIDAEPGVLATNKTIFTETDVCWDSWYLHQGRVPPSVLIEAGQADLLLISYMGVDFENRGERVYRLLGCDLSFEGALPPVGSTLHYDIHIDSFATHGDTRIFFFHSDARVGGPDGDVVLRVRNGQAGFFTDAELDDSGGMLWSPAEVDAASLQRRPLEEPPRPSSRASFERDDLEAWAAGDVLRCFGPGFERGSTHVRTPACPGGDMLLLDRVVEWSPRGGPWGRGYVRAELDFTPDRWFFKGHFKDDPCMPGTLMFEGCLQAMAFYLASCGYTLPRDGWRFEPGKGSFFKLRCRGQATPSSRRMVYEVFFKELVGGPHPKVTADILVTVDGLKSLLAEEVELELVPGWPLESRPELLGAAPKSGRDAVGGVGADEKGCTFGQRALLATAWGPPSEGYGPLYAPFDDGLRRVARLPGPPYHFMSRVRSVEGAAHGSMENGMGAVVEYDVPPDAWFFEESSDGAMPFSVLMEVALQPCGFVSAHLGSMRSERDLYYRNLDGKGRVHRPVLRGEGTLTIRSTMISLAQSGGMIIQQFRFEVSGSRGPVFDGETTFGFFTPEALANQVGLGASDDERARLTEPCAALPDGTPLPVSPDRYLPVQAALPAPMLLMLDRVTGYWPEGGSRGLGALRAEKDVDAGEWFFKAHFFQDPVMPGSLGIESMCQALRALVLERRLVDADDVVFEPIAAGEEVVWRYRGQVIPERETVRVEVELTEVTRAPDGSVLVVAEAWLWCDALRIYHAPRLVLRARPRG